jgi:hypothetical protein
MMTASGYRFMASGGGDLTPGRSKDPLPTYSVGSHSHGIAV